MDAAVSIYCTDELINMALSCYESLPIKRILKIPVDKFVSEYLKTGKTYLLKAGGEAHLCLLIDDIKFCEVVKVWVLSKAKEILFSTAMVCGENCKVVVCTGVVFETVRVEYSLGDCFT